MFIWWFLFDVAAIVIGLVLASRMKQSPVASTIGNGLGQLLSGLWTLQMTSDTVLAMDYDWREFMTDEAGGLCYFVFRFLGWGLVVMGIGLLLYALIQTLETQKAQPKAQWPTNVPGQAQPKTQLPTNVPGQAQPKTQLPTNIPGQAKQNAAPSVPQNSAAPQPAAAPQQAASAPAEADALETIFCPKCGRKQRKSNAVCWACNASLHD